MCEHNNAELTITRGHNKGEMMLVERCLDCGHVERANVCDLCDEGEAVYTHQCESEQGCLLEYSIWVCKECHIAIQGGLAGPPRPVLASVTST